MNKRSWHMVRGGTLLEVLVALTLMAVSALGVISAQLSMARRENAVAMRERAALIADSLVEAARGSTPESVTLAQWNVHAASMLHRGDVRFQELGDGLSMSIVRWDALREDSRGTPAGQGTCKTVAGAAAGEMSCASITFVRLAQ
ncbi:prepilin-type cleavage/methylation domain-containing protein [Trinickia terrae]|uniref:Prepilin-type cleavage/methylation domain-containing protein n=1 Tax=Trinickia terrae TaxID=2571161 RepID=A0A4U1IC03_9BURK|nr:prepilin-type cleavage/methylation domain-containing protein [Trinickia terrae]TKC91124.1 prepilin-type cleavage/methylation domain-containing protein [Trinickia terrae]